MGEKAGDRRTVADIVADPEYQARLAERKIVREAARALDAPEWAMVRSALEAQGIDATDLGRFVSDTRYLRPSFFDERAAVPVLIECLPRVSRYSVVGTVVSRLNNRWARPGAFDALLAAADRWAAVDDQIACQIGLSLGTATDLAHLGELIRVVTDPRYALVRVTAAEALWRFAKKDDRVVPLLQDLCADPVVCWTAMGTLRKAVGSEAALPIICQVRDGHPDSEVRKIASQQARRAEKAISKKQS